MSKETKKTNEEIHRDKIESQKDILSKLESLKMEVIRDTTRESTKELTDIIKIQAVTIKTQAEAMASSLGGLFGLIRPPMTPTNAMTPMTPIKPHSGAPMDSKGGGK